MSRRAPARRTRGGLAAGLVAVLAATLVQLAHPQPAGAAVTHLHGFRATVDGFTSWYGSYGMGHLGTAWCIDHGSRAPDPAYAYVPADLTAVPADVRAALGWAVATHGQGDDRIRHAGLMLALHDLMGARYPSGRLDVGRLTVARLAGFGGAESQVLAAARAIKADGLAHAALRGPLALTLTAGPVDASGHSTLAVAVRDSLGQGAAGVAVHLEGAGLATTVSTATDGTATAVAGPGTVHASAGVPRLPVDAWAPTTAHAQRVARPLLDELRATATVAPAAGELVIVKRGDATAWLPVTGATFRVEPAGGGAPRVVTVGAEGATPPVPLPAGTHRVVEQAPPPGYDVAGPWTVAVEPGRTTVLEVTDAAQRGTLLIRKVDEEAGALLAGAVLTVRYDADADGTFDTVVAELTTDGHAIPVDGLLPGRYEIGETRAPEGYLLLEQPVIVELAPGTVTDVWVANRSRPAPPTTLAPPAPPTTPAPPAPPPTTPATAPPVTVLGAAAVPAPAPATLPRTGVDALSLGLLGTGLVLIGRAATDLARVRAAREGAQPSAPSARRAAMRASS